MKLQLMVAAALASMASAALASTFQVSLFEIESRDLLGDPNNVVLTIDVAAELGLPPGTPALLTGAGWDLSLTNRGDSPLSEAKAYCDDNVSPDGAGVFIWPAEGDGATGFGLYNTGGIVDTADVVLPDGMLRIEFYELVDQHPGEWDTYWNGNIQLEVTPEPASVLLVAGVLLLRRHRRAA
jgi:hypothetical protein